MAGRDVVRSSQQSSPKLSSPAPVDRSLPRYTVFLRFPFPRNGFHDPPPVDWDATKDKALWKVISKVSSSGDVQWEEIAARFDVDLSFLLQQAAWLYERHFAGMKAQMQKLAAGPPGITTPALTEGSGTGSGAASAIDGGVAMQRQRSSGRLQCPGLED